MVYKRPDCSVFSNPSPTQNPDCIGGDTPAFWIVTFACLTCCFTTACGFRTGNRVLIPDGYIGWVQVFYRVASAPPFPKQEGKYLIEIDKSGRAYTSSPLPVGYGTDEYFYVSSSGSRIRLKDEGVERQQDDLVHHFTFTNYTSYGKSREEIKTEFETFFVGPRRAAEIKPAPTP